MATDPNTELIQKVRDLNRFRASQYARAAGAAVGGFPARLNEGSAAGAAYTDRMFARPQGGLTAAQQAAAKRAIIGDMADIRSEAEKNRLKAEADRIKAAKDAGESKLKMFLELITNQGTVSQRAAADMNASVLKVKGDAIERRLKALTPGTVGPAGASVSPAIAAYMKQYGTLSTSFTPDAWRDLLAMVADKPPSEQAEIIAGIAGAAGQGAEKFLDAIRASSATDANARALLDIAQRAPLAQAALSSVMLELNDQAERETLDMLKRGGIPGLDSETVQRQWAVFNQMYPDPEGFKESIEASGSGAPGEGDGSKARPTGADPKPELDALQKLLDQIDSDRPLPAGLAEARRRMFADPSFQKWKADNKFNDDAFALRQLRQATRDAVYRQLQQDRETAQANRLAKAKPPPVNAATPAVGGAAKEGSAVTPAAAPVDLTGLGLSDEEAKAALDAVKEEAPAKGPEEEAKPAAPAPGSPVKGFPTIGQMGAAAGNVVLRPGRTVEKLMARLRKTPDEIAAEEQETIE